MGTIANVLVGSAILSIRQPNDAIAEWANAQYQAGDYSVKLYKAGSGNDGSTHLEIIPPAGITMTAWTAAIVTNSFYHLLEALSANWIQMEFRFEDPNSEGWAEITAVPLQAHLGTGVWVKQTLADNTPCGYGGHTEIGTSFFVWGPLTDASLVQAAIDALDAAACAPGDWILTRVRLELWEAAPERTCYVDTVEIMGVTYTIEPGGTAPGLSLSSPYTEIGYTEDGVTVEYAAEEADIEVDEETFPIGSEITKETCQVTCNMAESSLENLNNAMAGAARSGNIISFGDGIQKYMNVKIEGITPDGFLAAIQIPKAVATGTVGRSFKKGTKTIVPITLKALKPQDDPAVTIVYNAA